MNFLFLDGYSSQYFANSVLLLDQKLNHSTKKIIQDNKIFLTITCSPGNVMSNFNFNPPDTLTGHLVTLDSVIIKHCKFTPSEVAAAIMHEFGHVLNKNIETSIKTKSIDDIRSGNNLIDEENKIIKETNRKNAEFYADYFASKHGFKTELIGSLKKYISSNLPYLDEEKIREIEERITVLSENKVFDDGVIRSLR